MAILCKNIDQEVDFILQELDRTNSAGSNQETFENTTNRCWINAGVWLDLNIGYSIFPEYLEFIVSLSVVGYVDIKEGQLSFLLLFNSILNLGILGI